MTRDTSLLQDQQAERLMQIGTYLREVREESMLSLEDVAARTLIQARLLRAIEAGKLNQLPEPVYIQGFIKRYAEALGLDGSEFADAFPTFQSHDRPVQVSWKDSPAAQLRPLHLYFAYVALIMASVSLLSHLINRSAPLANPVASTAPSSQQVQTAPQAASKAMSSPTGINPNSAKSSTLMPTVTASPSPLSRPSDADKPVRVAIKLVAQSWLEVEVDGQVKTAEVLQEGTERSWTANNQVRVRAGNAGGVLVAYNNGQARRMGAPGAVEEQTFTADQSAASLPNSETAPQ